MKARSIIVLFVLALAVSACGSAASPTATPTEVPATATPTIVPATNTPTEVPATATPTEIPASPTPALSPEEQEAVAYSLDTTCQDPKSIEIPMEFILRGGLALTARLKYFHEFPSNVEWGAVEAPKNENFGYHRFLKWVEIPSVSPAFVVGCASSWGTSKQPKQETVPMIFVVKIVQWVNPDGSIVFLTMLSPNGVAPIESVFPLYPRACPDGHYTWPTCDLVSSTETALLDRWITTGFVPPSLEAQILVSGLY